MARPHRSPAGPVRVAQPLSALTRRRGPHGPGPDAASKTRYRVGVRCGRAARARRGTGGARRGRLFRALPRPLRRPTGVRLRAVPGFSSTTGSPPASMGANRGSGRFSGMLIWPRFDRAEPGRCTSVQDGAQDRGVLPLSRGPGAVGRRIRRPTAPGIRRAAAAARSRHGKSEGKPRENHVADLAAVCGPHPGQSPRPEAARAGAARRSAGPIPRDRTATGSHRPPITPRGRPVNGTGHPTIAPDRCRTGPGASGVLAGHVGTIGG